MLYIATERVGWLVIGGGLLAIGFFFAYKMFGHVRVRVDTWLDPRGDYANTGYQISQSLFGLATGGIAGTGLGSGRPNQVTCAKTHFLDRKGAVQGTRGSVMVEHGGRRI